MKQIPPSALYPPGAGAPRYRLIDVRAPAEVTRGALPGAINLPILDDAERHAVGLRYAEAGQEAASRLGRDLTAPTMPARVASWRRVADLGPTAVACWRGGLRSELATRFIGREGVVRVAGGYRALRAYLGAELPAALVRRRTLVLTGLTGSGKTELLADLQRVPELLALDLEGAAEHRGSAFGALGEQPSQQTFEHRLLLPLVLSPAPLLLVEDESRSVGRCHLPEPLFAAMAAAPRLELEAPLGERVERIHREYALEPGLRHGSETALARLSADIRRLRRRLGTELTDHLARQLADIHAQGAWAESDAFREVIGALLERYYDPLYRKAAAPAKHLVTLRGDRETLTRHILKEARET